MKSRCESCNSCGMPLKEKEDFALANEEAIFCKYCVDEKGNLLNYEKILNSNAGYFKESQGITDAAAMMMAKNLLKDMPAWKHIGV